mmetsp:Transcript_17195/g.22333  ORF Transcript_17195/g.22333 Transcript_17195/m.22333 type:complete len:116 (+) Transcript_17195:509-856(+)
MKQINADQLQPSLHVGVYTNGCGNHVSYNYWSNIPQKSKTILKYSYFSYVSIFVPIASETRLPMLSIKPRETYAQSHGTLKDLLKKVQGMAQTMTNVKILLSQSKIIQGVLRLDI